MRRLRWVWLVALVAAAVFGLVKNHERIVGTHDVRMLYAVDDTWLTTQERADVLQSRVRARLGADKIAADLDVDLAEHSLALTVDDAVRTSVEALLHWRGGIAIHRLDPDYAIAPPARLTEVVETGPDGRPRKAWCGLRADAIYAVHELKPDADHAVFEQPIGRDRSCLRVVRTPAVADLFDAVDRVTQADGGRALAIALTKEGVEAVRKVGSAEPFVISWGRTVLAIQKLPEDAATPIVVSFGADLHAYDAAYKAKKLLATRPLPRLERRSEAALPVDYSLATAAVVVPILVSFAWLFFVRRFDRAQPEPLWLVLATFALGAAVAPVSAVARGYVYWAVPALDPHLETLGGQLLGFPLTLLTAAGTIGVAEEGVKFLATWTLPRQRSEFDEPVDGIVYGAAASLGFAAMENVSYLDRGRLLSGLVTIRGFYSAPAHLFFGAFWGYALGQTLVQRRYRILPLFLLAALAHGAFDTFCFIDALGSLTDVESALLAGAFVLLLRRALRHGRVTPAVAGVTPESRRLFGVGRRPVFVAYTVALLSGAWITMRLARWFDAQHHRVSYAFLATGGALLLVLGAVASGLAHNLPLDVVVDDHGVTFAGAARAWASIRGVRRWRDSLWLASIDGDLMLGPADGATLDALEKAIGEARVALADTRRPG